MKEDNIKIDKQELLKQNREEILKRALCWNGNSNRP